MAQASGLMKSYDGVEKLAILRREDRFRDWHSLDDRRVCVVCGGNFAGRDIIVSENSNCHELHCPSLGCRSRTHQWVYPDNPAITEEIEADWWRALGHPAAYRVHAI